MIFDTLTTEIRQIILSARDTRELDAMRTLTARRLHNLEEEIAHIHTRRSRWASFQAERLAGGTVYELPLPAVAWIEKALPKYEVDRMFLDCVHVVEWADKLWLMGADGFHLHASVIDANIPTGLYYAADNMIVPAEGVAASKSYAEIVPRESSKLLLPQPVTGNKEGVAYCAWSIYADGTLHETEAANGSYFVDRRFYDDARSFSPETPTYGLLRGPSDTFHLFWSDRALAVIMPLRADEMKK